MATDPANPLVNPQLGFPDGQTVLKYEQMDGTLGDDLANAKREWTPDVDLCVLTGHHVRMLPQTSAGLYDAYGVLIIKPMTLGTLKALTLRIGLSIALFIILMVSYKLGIFPARH